MKKTLLLAIILILFCFHIIVLCNNEGGGKSNGKDTTDSIEVIPAHSDSSLNVIKSQIESINDEINALKKQQKINFWISFIPLLIFFLHILRENYLEWRKNTNIRYMISLEVKELFFSFSTLVSDTKDIDEIDAINHIMRNGNLIKTNIFDAYLKDLRCLKRNEIKRIFEVYDEIKFFKDSFFELQGAKINELMKYMRNNNLSSLDNVRNSKNNLLYSRAWEVFRLQENMEVISDHLLRLNRIM